VEISDKLNTRLEQEIATENALLKDYPIEENVLVILVRRNHKHIVPKSSLQLLKEDILLLLSNEEEKQNSEPQTKKRKTYLLPFRKHLK
jgi:TrkA-C domain.